MSATPAKPPLAIHCPHCGQITVFDQPYPYHAGFGNRGFLYNDEGTLTLVWESYDKVFRALVGPIHPCDLKDPETKRAFEEALRPAPKGGHWRFRNPARCPHCFGEISGSIEQTIRYLRFPGSPTIKSLQEVLITDYESLADKIPKQKPEHRRMQPEELKELRRILAEKLGRPKRNQEKN